MNDADIDTYLKCCAASSAAKCWGTTYHDTSCPRGTTCGNTSSPGGLPMATCGPGGLPVGGTISCMTVHIGIHVATAANKNAPFSDTILVTLIGYVNRFQPMGLLCLRVD